MYSREFFTSESISYLSSRYHHSHTDLRSDLNKNGMLVDSIVPSDLMAISGRGAMILTNAGPLIDFQSMTVNCILGQNDPWVKLQQIAYLASDRPSFHTTKLGSELYYSLPQRLINLGVGGIKDAVVSHRQCNGSDAVEHAIKAASVAHPDRRLLVSFEGSYHGQNLTAYTVSHVQRRHKFLAESNSVVYLPAPDGTDSIYTDYGLSARERQALDQLELIAPNVFAVIVEPIQMNNGVQPYSSSYLRALQQVCALHDICLVYDEIQTGFGWLGKMSAAEYHGAPPDIGAFGKALTAGNGPLALTIANRRYRHMEQGTASKTNGADVRALVAAHAVVDRLVGIPEAAIPAFLGPQLRAELARGLLADVNVKATHLWERLCSMAERFPNTIARVKGGGLMCGLELVDATGSPSPRLADVVMESCFRSGLFLRITRHALIVKVPLTITMEELDRGCDILAARIGEAAYR
ncbi:aminotransferase class III-fold pyridoxal phosphate-dependent enzyme [Cupriavidus sp. WGtm5]|uniref:aminotransferase class III-fold pyridoxal phosphate-dependent enzyme n=1 Tax=Cupriavidus sp. WGtm5 TaxID=2919926 RepID=UPI00208FFD66|nr:aminotransferase class III-fold pyridoxal phosphate-dependent enzyme [Cupriavidus sp. WGtm5]MCO4892189.1 aminotransferase class III-fold pyridoxal phosphate-dependent enzyme [Cupriavidus sp. WGtm5]